MRSSSSEKSFIASRISCFAAAAALGLPWLSAPALAQQPIALPGITVQGATLEAPSRPAPRAPAQAPATTAAGEAAAGETEQSSIAGVPAYSVGNAVSVITGEELRNQQIRHAAEALRSLPGVSVSRSGGVGNLTQVRIRGAEGNHTLVLVDGIEANNTADGEFDFSNLSADDIERIEVIRGPMSGLYGSNAVGGVINIVTRRGQGPMSVTVRAEGGSLGTRDVSGRVGVGNDKAHFAASFHGRDTDGFNIAPFGNERDGSRIDTFLIRAGATLLPGLTLDFTVRNTVKDAARDGFGGVTPGALATAYDDGSSLAHRVLLAGVVLRWELLGGRLVQEARANKNNTITSDVDRTFLSSSRNESDADKLSYLASYRLDMPSIRSSSTFTGRLEREDERFTPSGDFADGLKRERGRVAYTGEWRGSFADRLFLTAGVRHDDNDNFRDFTTWRTAASLWFPEIGLRPHASAGTAVKLPTMFEQFGTDQFFRPNAGLSPEESFGWDAGIELSFHKGQTVLDVTYFNANLTNKIDGFFFDPVIGNFTARNLPGESTREGVEVAARVKVHRDVTLGGAYTYTDARDPNGDRELRRPPHSARADIAYAFHGGRGNATLAAIYNGRMEDRAFELPFFFPSRRVPLDPYWLVNATASYKVHPGFELFARVENILDQHYQEAFGFESAPIAAYAGFKLTLGGTEDRGTAWLK